jgi:hypothetical protein
MRVPLLKAHLEMLPRLQAEESLNRVLEGQAADSMIDSKGRNKIIDAWLDQTKTPKPKLTPEQAAMEMALIGITVTRV